MNMMINSQIMDILTVYPRFADGSNMRFKPKRGAKDDFKVFGLFTRKMEMPLMR